MKTSAGAPASICFARALLAPYETTMEVPVSPSNFLACASNDSLRLAAANTVRTAELTAVAPKTRPTPTIVTATGLIHSNMLKGDQRALEKGNISSYITIGKLSRPATAATIAGGVLADLRYDGAADNVRPAMEFAFIIDPLASLKAYKDTSVAMMRPVQTRGAILFVLEPADLFWTAAATP